MARYRGSFTVAANYEPLKAAPFDARELVDTQADLINVLTWKHEDGGIWTYVGMRVSVANDEDASKNGVYVLVGDDFTKLANWQKLADQRDVERLHEEIKNIEISTEGTVSIDVDTMEDLPKIGDEDAVYYVKENLSIQRWDVKSQSYLPFGNPGGSPELDIKVIYGGNAHVTD